MDKPKYPITDEDYWLYIRSLHDCQSHDEVNSSQHHFVQTNENTFGATDNACRFVMGCMCQIGEDKDEY
jgi:hypothetical protein